MGVLASSLVVSDYPTYLKGSSWSFFLGINRILLDLSYDTPDKSDKSEDFRKVIDSAMDFPSELWLEVLELLYRDSGVQSILYFSAACQWTHRLSLPLIYRSVTL